MSATQNTSWIELPRRPYANGRLRGRLGGPVLRMRIVETRRIRKAQKIAESLIQSRIREFTAILRKVAPAWLEEVKGLADGAGVAPDDILMLNCLPPGFYPPQGLHCTTFIAIGATHNQLFKIRDERNRIQAFYIHPLPDGSSYQAGHDIGNLGVAHFLNSHGVGGANNTGSHTVHVPERPLLNDCHILRYFAEHARRVADIPELFARLVDKRAAGGAGPGRGAIYTAVDADQGLMLETHATDYVATFVRAGIRVVANHFLTKKARAWWSQKPNHNTLARQARMEELLARLGRTPAPADVFAMSRDRKNVPNSLCNDDRRHFWMTISAQLHVINRVAPEKSVNYMCCGNTRHSVYVPVPLSAAASYAPLLDGRYYQLTDHLYQRYCGRNVLGKLQAEFEERCLKTPFEPGRVTAAYALLRQAAGRG